MDRSKLPELTNKPKMSPRVLLKRHPRLALLLGAVLIGALIVFVSMRPKPVTVQAATLGPIAQTIVVSGRVMSPARVNIGATVTGRVQKVFVREGDKVTVGQPLIELERDELQSAADQARETERAANARLQNVSNIALPNARQSLAQARANLEFAEGELERNRDLLAKGFIAKSRLDDIERNVEVARGQYEIAKNTIASQGRGGPQFLDAEAQLRQARAQRMKEEAKLEQTRIRASADGVILTRDVEVGDVVQPGKTLLALSATGDTRVSGQIDERNLSLVRVGNIATMAPDSFPNVRFQGEMFYLAPGVDAQRGTVEARFRVKEPPKELLADMTVSIEILGAEKAQAVTIPTAALRGGNSSSSVWVIQDHRIAARTVKVGLRGNNAVEILEGLNAGEQVVIDGGAKLGQRARAVITKTVEANR